LSAIFVLVQNGGVQLMTDGAAYDWETGELHYVDFVKCIAFPDLQMAIACTGPALLLRYLSEQIEDEFDSFDDFVSRGESLLPDMFRDYADENCNCDAVSTFYVGGWHRHATPRAAAYCMDLWTDESTRIAQVIENSSLDSEAERFKFEEFRLSGTPVPDSDLIKAAGLKIPDDANSMRPELDLLHLMEIARHKQIEDRYLIGGNALLTSVGPNGVKQKIVHKWEEDKVGSPISPLPIIDWKAWRAARLRIPAGLSFGTRAA
jgi:hypothetical protein